MTKESLKIKYFHFAWWCERPKGGFVLHAKENFKIDFAWSCEILQEDVNCYYCIFYFEQSCEIA